MLNRFFSATKQQFSYANSKDFLAKVTNKVGEIASNPLSLQGLIADGIREKSGKPLLNTLWQTRKPFIAQAVDMPVKKAGLKVG